MLPWREDFSSCSLEEVLGWQAQNREWSKELRRKINSLVNSRLSKSISLADYLAVRKLAHEDTAECQRRASILNAQVVRASGSSRG